MQSMRRWIRYVQEQRQKKRQAEARRGEEDRRREMKAARR